MRSRILDRPRPLETDVAVAGLYGKLGDVARKVDSRAMDVQLRLTDAIGDTRRRPVRNDFGAEDFAIEASRSLPIRNRDDSMVQAAGNQRRR